MKKWKETERNGKKWKETEGNGKKWKEMERNGKTAQISNKSEKYPTNLDFY